MDISIPKISRKVVLSKTKKNILIIKTNLSRRYKNFVYMHLIIKLHIISRN